MTQMTQAHHNVFFRYFEASHSRSIRRQRGLTQWKEMFNVLHFLINLKLWVNVNLRIVKSGILPNFGWVFLVKEFDDWCNCSSLTAEFVRKKNRWNCSGMALHLLAMPFQSIGRSKSRSTKAAAHQWMHPPQMHGAKTVWPKMMKKYENFLTLQLLTTFSRFGWLFWCFFWRKNPYFEGRRGSRMLTFHQAKSPRFRWQLDSTFWAPSTSRHFRMFQVTLSQQATWVSWAIFFCGWIAEKLIKIWPKKPFFCYI